MADLFKTAVNAAKTPLFEVAVPLIVGAVVVAVFRTFVLHK